MEEATQTRHVIKLQVKNWCNHNIVSKFYNIFILPIKKVTSENRGYGFKKLTLDKAKSVGESRRAEGVRVGGSER